MINLWFSTKEELEKRAKTGCFGRHLAVICFYGKDEQPVDLSKHEAEYICAYLDEPVSFDAPDVHKGEFFPDADRVADIAVRAVAEGKALFFQEDTRGLSCAAAVLEFFTGGGMQVFGRVRFRTGRHCLDVKIYERVYGALCCAKLLHDDIDFDKLRTGRAAFDRQEMISKIYDIMADECAYLGNYGSGAGQSHSVFAFASVTSDKVFHYYAAGLFPNSFLDKYSKDDIEYFGVEIERAENKYGAAFMDSECGSSFTVGHLKEYFRLIKDKFGVTEEEVYD